MRRAALNLFPKRRTDKLLWCSSVQLKPLQFADGEILMHVFDISYNNLSGRLPSFLDFTNVPEYAQRGIFIAVSFTLVKIS